MITHDFHGTNISALGLGCMRLPTLEANEQIDMVKLQEMVDYAINHGINYFDTAWFYHGGNSESAMGQVLKAYPRECFCLATKFPSFDRDFFEHGPEIFEKQLANCQVDYFDFYLLHNVCESNIDWFLDLGVVDYLLEQKKLGRIRHFGFSTHGNLETIGRLLDAYGEHIEFCQIQLNWLDWSFQNAKGKVELLKAYNIPIWVMEPLRGGKLAKISSPNTAKLKALRPNEETPAWAFRFLQSIEGVTMTLSGMSDEQQMKENIATYETESPLNEEERNLLLSIGESLVGGVPCTSCRYCVGECPQGLNIPELLYLYNEHVYTNGGFLPMMRLNVLPENKRPQACVGCRSCEAVCPQNIKISEVMDAFASRL